MTVKNAAQTAVAAQTDNLAAILTTHVQSGCTANSNAVVNVNSVTKAANGDLQLTYTCSGVSDHDTCQQSLNTAAQSPAIQQTVGKCSQSSDTTSKPTQKPTAAPAPTTTKAAATTQKPQTQAPTTTKKPETQAPATTKKPADTTKASVQSSTKSGKKMSRLIFVILSYLIKIQ
jgi:hypothetical protein